MYQMPGLYTFSALFVDRVVFRVRIRYPNANITVEDRIRISFLADRMSVDEAVDYFIRHKALSNLSKSLPINLRLSRHDAIKLRKVLDEFIDSGKEFFTDLHPADPSITCSGYGYRDYEFTSQEDFV